MHAASLRYLDGGARTLDELAVEQALRTLELPSGVALLRLGLGQVSLGRLIVRLSLLRGRLENAIDVLAVNYDT